MAVYECEVCATRYDEAADGRTWDELPDDWGCPVCESDRSYFTIVSDQRGTDADADADLETENDTKAGPHGALRPVGAPDVTDTTGTASRAGAEAYDVYECEVCATVYDEVAEDVPFDELPEDWSCPVCDSDASYFHPRITSSDGRGAGAPDDASTATAPDTAPDTARSSRLVYECGVCGYIYDEEEEGVEWSALPDSWRCPVCESDNSYFSAKEITAPAPGEETEPLIWVCTICGYIYDEAKVGRPFEGLPDSWRCPVCDSPKRYFELTDEVALIYICSVCGYIYDEAQEGRKWADLPKSWVCPVCESDNSYFRLTSTSVDTLLAREMPEGLERDDDEHETHMNAIHQMAKSGESVYEPMRSTKTIVSWDDILIKGAQLATLPLNEETPVNTTTVIGPNAAAPLVIETPIYITHMSFGALSRECKLALSKGSALVKSAMCSGEGGILPGSMTAAYRYIFEYIPNRYSVTDENLRAADAIEIKIGQSAKPGMGGHLPGTKVTREIAAVRGFPPRSDIVSPAHYPDITSKEELKAKVDLLRERSGGKPIGVKFAAGDIEGDLAVALFAQPDFITIDGRPGATGAAPKFVKDATSIPTVYALSRARTYLDTHGGENISLVITGGLRVSSDFAKAIAMGADAVAIGTAALMACGCQQYRVCHTGKCPMGITSQEPALRKRIDIDTAAERVANFLRVATEELETFARLTGNGDVHSLAMNNICTVDTEIANHTDIRHV